MSACIICGASVDISPPQTTPGAFFFIGPVRCVQCLEDERAALVAERQTYAESEADALIRNWQASGCTIDYLRVLLISAFERDYD